MNRYDIMIAQRVNSFKLTNILSDDKNNLNKGINSDYFEFYQKTTQTPDLVLGPFTWSIDSMTHNQMNLSTKHGTNCVVKDPATGEQYQVTHCAIKTTFHLDELLNRSETNDNWVNFSANIEVEENLSLSTIQNMKNKMEDFIKGRKTSIREIFFKKEVCSKFKLHDNVTASTIFIHQADQGMNGAYFCLGQMLDKRILPDKPNFPDDIAKESPPFIFHLSPYAYFCLGLKPNLQKQYPDNIISFDEEHSKLTLHNFPIDKEPIAKALKIRKEQVTNASIRELSFCLNNAYFSYQYEMYLHILDTKLIVIPDPYSVEAKAKQVFNMYLKNNRIDVQELPNMKEFKAVKSADNPMIDEVIAEIEKDLFLVADLLIRIVLPLAIDIECGLNPVAGCALFSLFNTFADFLEDAYKEAKENQSMEEARQLNALEMSFKKLMPFNIENISIKKFEVRDGIIISGDVRSNRFFLLRGESLFLGERLIGDNSQLVFQEDGGLVFYKTEQEKPQPADELWRYDKHWKTQNYQKGANEIKIDEKGGLTAYKDDKYLWDIYIGDSAVNFLYLSRYGFTLVSINDSDIKELMDVMQNKGVGHYKKIYLDNIRRYPRQYNIY
jgi:hypothetical protein